MVGLKHVSNAKLFVTGILLLALFLFVGKFFSVLNLFCIAAIFAFLLRPVSQLLRRRLHFPRALAVFVTLLLVCGLLVFFISTLAPVLLGQARLLVENIPDYGKALNKLYMQLQNLLEDHQLPAGLIQTTNQMIEKLEATATQWLLRAVAAVFNWSSQLLNFVIILVVTVYLMLDAKKILLRFSRLFPTSVGEHFLALVAEYNDLVWRYLKSKAIVALGMAVATFLVLSVVGVESAFFLACLAFLMDFIPYFGSIIAGLIAALVALLTGGWVQALVTAGCILVIQQIEGNIVAPKVQGDSVGLHPLVVMFSLLACNQLWGVMGMFISVPVASFVKIVLRETYHFLIQDVDMQRPAPPDDPTALPARSAGAAPPAGDAKP